MAQNWNRLYEPVRELLHALEEDAAYRSESDDANYEGVETTMLLEQIQRIIDEEERPAEPCERCIETYGAIASRVLFGEMNGGFVEYMAQNDFGRAVFYGDGHNGGDHFRNLMKARVQSLPLKPVELRTDHPGMLREEEHAEVTRRIEQATQTYLMS